jgi:hypothetical protein
LLAPALLKMLGACLPFLQSARAPMEHIALPPGVPSGDCVVVLLPGRFGSSRDFIRSGFVEAIEARGLDLPVVAADAHLGYGDEDRFAAAAALFAETLPEGRTFIVPGGHRWPVWAEIWGELLDAGIPCR